MLAGVVFAEERGQALVELVHRLIAPDINVVILHRAPQALDHDIVQGTSFAIHANVDAMAPEHAREGLAGELAALGRC